MSYDTNPNMSPTPLTGIWTMSATPSYQVTGIFGRDLFDAGLSVDLAHSSDSAISADRKDPAVSLDWRRSFPEGDFGVAGSYAQASTRVTEFTDTGLVGQDQTRSMTSLSTDLNRQISERLGLTLNAGFNDVAYSGGGYTDYRTWSSGARLSRALNEKTDIYTSMSISHYVPKSSPVPASSGSTSTSLDASVGVSLKMAEGLDANAHVGLNRTTGRSASGWIGGLALNYALSERSTASINLDHSVAASGIGSFTTSSQMGGQWNYLISDRLSTGAEFSWRKNSSGYQSRTSQLNIWLNDELSDYWQLRMSYLHRVSEQDGFAGARGDLFSLTLIYSNPNPELL